MPEARLGALDPDVHVEALEVALRRRRDRLLEHAPRVDVAVAPPRRRPQRQTDDLGPVDAAGDQRGGIDVETFPSPSSSAMKLDDFACATWAISARVTGSSWASGPVRRVRSDSTASSDVRQWSTRRPCELM